MNHEAHEGHEGEVLTSPMRTMRFAWLTASYGLCVHRASVVD